MCIEDNTTADSCASKIMRVLRTIWPMLVVTAILLVVQRHSLAAWWNIWNLEDGYYSHGILVPFLSAVIVWTRRHKLVLEEVRPSKLGILFMAIFLPVFALGSLTEVRELQAMAFLAGLFGGALLTLGIRATRILAIPFLFLTTMMPISGFLLDAATGRFQLISTSVAVAILKIGLDAQRIGNTIFSDSLPESLVIGTPCSGLRLLISLITFCWLFTCIFEASWWKKSLLILCVFPLSIFINSLRITLIGLAGVVTQSVDWMHKFHGYSGMIGLILSSAILFGIAKLLRFGEMIGCEEKRGCAFIPLAGPPMWGLVVAVAFQSVPIIFSSHIATLYDYPKGSIDKARVPTTTDTWTYADQSIEESTRKILEKGDLMSGIYADNSEPQRLVRLFIDAAYDYTAFHDPHLCLPGGGSQITTDTVIHINFIEPRPITVTATRLQTTREYGSNLHVYWYQMGDESVAGTGDMYAVFRGWRADDFRQIIMRPWEIPKLRKEILKRKITWYSFSAPMQGNGEDDSFVVSFIRKWVSAYGEL